MPEGSTFLGFAAGISGWFYCDARNAAPTGALTALKKWPPDCDAQPIPRVSRRRRLGSWQCLSGSWRGRRSFC